MCIELLCPPPPATVEYILKVGNNRERKVCPFKSDCFSYWDYNRKMNKVKRTLTTAETRFCSKISTRKYLGREKRACFNDELRNIRRRRYVNILGKKNCRITQRIFKRNWKTPKRKNEIKMGQQVMTDVTYKGHKTNFRRGCMKTKGQIYF